MTDSCRQSSLEASETLLGSAPASTNYWFLVESRTPFTPKVVKEGPLAEQLRPLTERLANKIPTSRVQFIRRPEMRHAEEPLAFIADARQPEARLFGRKFDRHEDLLDIEWSTEPSSQRQADSQHWLILVLICTHGKRDACCAACTRAFMKVVSENRELVWESSHIGGHRFAATCVTLPTGHYYGRLNATMRRLVESTMKIDSLTSNIPRLCNTPCSCTGRRGTATRIFGTSRYLRGSIRRKG